MFPPDVRALIERTSQAEFRPEEVLPMLAGGAASFIPIPGAGPMAALAAQGALGGAAALGTESALKGELPTPGRAAAEIGAGGLFGPLGRLFGKGLKFLGESGLAKAFKISKLQPKGMHTPSRQIARELTEEHGGITGTRGAIEESMRKAKSELSESYENLMKGPEGKKTFDAEVVYNLAMDDVSNLKGVSATEKNKIRKMILEKLDAEKAEGMISKAGKSNLKRGHDLKFAASKKADFGDPEKNAKEKANELLSLQMEEQLKSVSEPYRKLSEEAKKRFYQFRDFVEASGEQAQRQGLLGLPQQVTTAAAVLSGHPAAALPAALSFTERFPGISTQVMRGGDFLENLSRLRAIPSVAAFHATGEEDSEGKRRKQRQLLGVP